MAKRKRKNKNLKKKLIGIFASFVVIISLAVTYLPDTPNWNDIFKAAGLNSGVVQKDGNFYAHYIDVGQADCELLVCGDDVVMIDTGDVDSYQTVKSYLEFQNIEVIDYLILTHAHADHIGSADDIINNFTVENIIMPRYTEENMPTSSLYSNLLDVIGNSQANVYAAKAGDEYRLDSFYFDILAPNKDYKDINNTSVVIKATFINNTFIFQADAEEESEEDILSAGYDISADVIKLGHHGSRTSSSLDYIKAVNPQIAVISCGADNSYKHPHPETIAKLESIGTIYYRTDVCGNIVIESDGTHFSVITER